MMRIIILFFISIIPSLTLANINEKSSVLSRLDVNGLTGGLCSSQTVDDCGGGEEIISNKSNKHWWVKFKPRVIFSKFCLSYTDWHSASDDEFSRTTTFMVGREIGGSCSNLIPYFPPKLFQGISVDAMSFLMDKKDEIELKVKNGIQFSKCHPIDKIEYSGVRVHSASVNLRDSSEPVYELRVGVDSIDELYSVTYSVKAHKEICTL